MSRTKGLRRVRVAQGAVIFFETGGGVFEALRGSAVGVGILAVCTVAVVLAMVWLTGKIRQREYLDRPRPDYSAIAAMEREVYGETFKHDGAPRRSEAAPPTMPATPPPPRPKHDRAQRWDGLTTHPDTTEPATIGQYTAWLRGYVKRGGKPTHFYGRPFSRADFRYAASTVTVDSDYEYGSSSRRIIVANGVLTERTNPAGPFGGWAHTKCYFMHGYRTSDSIVPVYSDPEFDEFRADRPCDCDDRRSNLRWERPS